MSTNVAAQRTCARCGQTFAPRSNFAKWCDACCTYICVQCGQSFISRRNRRVRFCSLDCTNIWQDTHSAKEAARQRTITVRGSGRVQRCKTCGESFYVPGWRLRQPVNVKYCSHACRNYPEDQKGINRVLRFPARPEANRLEAAGRAILDVMGVVYAEQEVIGGKFVVDVLITSVRLIIQWDGDFWHANPAIYPEPAHAIQQINVRRDRQCDAYLAKCNYRVLRFWESDVHQRPSWVSAEIARALASSANT